MQKYITAQNVSTTDQELLELYEQRYKPEMLAAAEAKAEANASTNYSYLLQAEGLSVIEADTDAAFSEGGERPLYLGTPAGAGDAEGIDLAAASGSHAEGIGEADEEPESCPIPSAADRELVDTLRERGHAAAPSEVAHHAGADMDVLGSATLTHYRHHAGHVLLATSAATDEDLDRAANRAEADSIGHAFERSVGHASAVASRLIQRLTDIGGSGSLDEARRHLAALGCDRRAIRQVIGELHRRGLVRISVRGAAPAKEQRDQRQRFITLADAAEGSLAMAAGRYNDDLSKVPARRAEAAELRKSEGQDKAFTAPFVPFGGTSVGPAEQRRALYIERAKALYAEASPMGVSAVTLRLAEIVTDEGKLPEKEVTLYSAADDEAGSFTDFFREKLKARILTGLCRNGHLSQRRMISALFSERSTEILAFLSEGRAMSPQLAEPYELFRGAARELIEEGKARHTRKGFVLADPESGRLPAAAEVGEEATEWADEDPEPESQSGPEPYGADRYAADMAGAHDHRAIASGPQAPSRRPAQREKAARRISGAISRARAAEDAPARAEAANRKAMANAAWREALDQHMVALGADERLELYLQLEGEQRLERMVEAAEEPDELYRAAIVLKDAGRIQVRQHGGYTMISATSELNREELGGDLVEVMARHGISVPEGTALESRVEAARKLIAKVAA